MNIDRTSTLSVCMNLIFQYCMDHSNKPRKSRWIIGEDGVGPTTSKRCQDGHIGRQFPGCFLDGCDGQGFPSSHQAAWQIVISAQRLQSLMLLVRADPARIWYCVDAGPLLVSTGPVSSQCQMFVTCPPIYMHEHARDKLRTFGGNSSFTKLSFVEDTSWTIEWAMRVHLVVMCEGVGIFGL